MSGKRPTVLIVDDTKENIKILLSLLQEYDLLAARDGEKALRMVKKFDVDLVLLDIMMPGMDGYEVCRILQADEKTRDIPILFITAKSDEESIEAAFESGGSDYVTKPFKPRELLARVRMQLKLRETQKALLYAAEHDPLTGCYNRRKFFEEGRALLPSENLYAIMLDIDKFKKINDRYGHAFGDTVIRHLVSTISHWLREDALFGRLGGEEFAILCHAPDEETARHRIETLRRNVENSRVPNENSFVRFSISCGISRKKPEDTLDTLLNRADEALYQAKEEGRNRIRFRV